MTVQEFKKWLSQLSDDTVLYVGNDGDEPRKVTGIYVDGEKNEGYISFK